MTRPFRLEAEKLRDRRYWLNALLVLAGCLLAGLPSILAPTLQLTRNEPLDPEILPLAPQAAAAIMRGALGSPHLMVFGMWVTYVAAYGWQNGIYGRYALSGLSWAGRVWAQLLNMTFKGGIVWVFTVFALLLVAVFLPLPFSGYLQGLDGRLLLGNFLQIWLVGLFGLLLGNVIRNFISIIIFIVYKIGEGIVDMLLDARFESPWWNRLPLRAIGQSLEEKATNVDLVFILAYTALFLFLNALLLRRPNL